MEEQEETHADATISHTGSNKQTIINKLVKEVEVADIGCGFGGLLVALAPKLPDKLLLGGSTFLAIPVLRSESLYLRY